MPEPRQSEANPNICTVRFDGRTWAFPTGLFNEGEIVLWVPAGYTLTPESVVKETMGKLDRPFDVREWLVDGELMGGVVIKAPKYLKDRNMPTSCYETTGIRRTQVATTNYGTRSTTYTYTPGHCVCSFHNWPRVHSEFKDQEVAILEYVEGQHARYSCSDKEEFKAYAYKSEKRDDTTDPWWQIARRYELADKMKEHCPGHTLLGMLWGNVRPSWTYGRRDMDFVVIDIHASPAAEGETTARFLSYTEIADVCAKLGVQHAPLLSIEDYDEKKNYASGPSALYPGPRAGAIIIRMTGRKGTGNEYFKGYAIEKMPAPEKAKKEEVNTDG